MLGQIIEPDFVLLAAPAPSDELAGRGAQRLLGVQDVGSGTHLLIHYRVDLWVVAVELGKFRGNVAGGEDGAGAERVLDRDERRTSGREHRRKRENKKQRHAKSTVGLDLEIVPAWRRQRKSRSRRFLVNRTPSLSPAARGRDTAVRHSGRLQGGLLARSKCSLVEILDQLVE